MHLSPEFITDAMRTNSNVTGTFNIKPDTIHAVLGVASEIIEFSDAVLLSDYVNAREELGDALWFAALYQQSTGVVIVIDDHRFESVDACMDTILNMFKAAYAYGGKKEKSVQDLLELVGKAIGHAIWQLSIDMSKIDYDYNKLNYDPSSIEETIGAAQKKVIAKLRDRFPDKFTTEAARFRDTESERAVLEQE